MHCTNCGSTLPQSAKFCGNCGTPAKSASATNLQHGQQRSSTSVQNFGIAALVVMSVLTLAVISSGSRDTAASADARQIINVTPEDLRAAYDANEAAAQQQYGDVRLAVTGKIAAIDLDIVDDPVVLLETAKPYDRVHAKLADQSKAEAAQFAKGQEITLTCSDISEIVGTPMLRDCVWSA